jgi:hypothetical protein
MNNDDLKKLREICSEGYESMELVTGATLNPLRRKISYTISSLHNLKNVVADFEFRHEQAKVLLDQIQAIIDVLED